MLHQGQKHSGFQTSLQKQEYLLSYQKATKYYPTCIIASRNAIDDSVSVVLNKHEVISVEASMSIIMVLYTIIKYWTLIGVMVISIDPMFQRAGISNP
jgi:hypothetical protein